MIATRLLLSHNVYIGSILAGFRHDSCTGRTTHTYIFSHSPSFPNCNGAQRVNASPTSPFFALESLSTCFLPLTHILYHRNRFTLNMAKKKGSLKYKSVEEILQPLMTRQKYSIVDYNQPKSS
jgi:hypothetical protein